jgi:hypothetical protein
VLFTIQGRIYLLLLDLGTTQKANNAEHGDCRKREVQMLEEGGFGPIYKVWFNVPKR